MWHWLFTLRTYFFHLLWLYFVWGSRVGGCRGTEKPCEETRTPNGTQVRWKDSCWIYHQPFELSKSTWWSCQCLWSPHLGSKHQGLPRWSERCRAALLLIHPLAPSRRQLPWEIFVWAAPELWEIDCTSTFDSSDLWNSNETTSELDHIKREILCCILTQCLLARLINLGLVLSYYYHMFVKDWLKSTVDS